MSQPISDLMGVGNVAGEIFTLAGYTTLGQLMELGYDDRKILDAIQTVKATKLQFPASYWRRLATRCTNINHRLRSRTAAPYTPDFFMCPITLDWFTDPVVTPSGHTYEREDLLEWIYNNGTDPQTRIPLTLDQIFPNRNLLTSQEYYRRNILLYSVPLND